MTAFVGARVTGTWTAAELTAGGVGFGLGDRFVDQAGKEYVFVQASSAISQYDAVTYDETYNTVVAPVSTANDAIGDKIGVAPVAIASGSYGWLQIYGVATVNAIASTAANAKLSTSGTPGFIDDATTSVGTILGMVLTTTRAASNGTAPAVLNYPFIDTIV